MLMFASYAKESKNTVKSIPYTSNLFVYVCIKVSLNTNQTSHAELVYYYTVSDSC